MVGIDIIENRRIKKVYGKFGSKFLNRIFTPLEINYIESKNFSIETMAGLYAAKEAISKAVGTGIGKLSFKDMEIIHDVWGKPKSYIENKNIHIAISHEKHYSIALASLNRPLIDRTIPLEFKGLFQKRLAQTHKGDYGKIAIYAGSIGMTGAAYLSCNAAFRAGAGLVYNIVPKNLLEIMSIKHTEVITKSFKDSHEELNFLTDMNVIAAGPAMGTGREQREKFKMFLDAAKPLVLDADAITLLSKNPSILKAMHHREVILTPHTGEFSRLINISVSEIESNREYYSRKFADKYNITLVLKGSNTIVTNGDEYYVNKSGNPGMATAGSGDVLTGITSALCVYHNSFTAAKLGVFLHGMAGDFAASQLGEESMLASDIVSGISPAIQSLKYNKYVEEL